MVIDYLIQFLGWCIIINVGLLLWWSLFILFGRDFVYRAHSRIFKMSEESFVKIHYTGMMFFKLLVFVFNLVPYCALQIIRAG